MGSGPLLYIGQTNQHRPQTNKSKLDLTVFMLLTGTNLSLGNLHVSGGCAMAKSTRYTGRGLEACLRLYLKAVAAVQHNMMACCYCCNYCCCCCSDPQHAAAIHAITSANASTIALLWLLLLHDVCVPGELIHRILLLLLLLLLQTPICSLTVAEAPQPPALLLLHCDAVMHDRRLPLHCDAVMHDYSLHTGKPSLWPMHACWLLAIFLSYP